PTYPILPLTALGPSGLRSRTNALANNGVRDFAGAGILQPMSRIKFAAEILSPLNPTSILDVGCRDASLADEFPTAEYAGADLNSDTRGRVKYVGDIARISLDR